MWFRRLVCFTMFCATIYGATLVSSGYSGIVTDGTVLDLNGGAPDAVSFYYTGGGVGQVVAFDDFGGIGNPLAAGDLLPAMGILTPAGVTYPGFDAFSLVFDLDGDIEIEQLTFEGLVVPEPGASAIAGAGLLLMCLRSRRRTG